MAVISVIVPVYNTEKLLGRCLDSILCQTFGDFDVVLVNDGSKDGSGAICDAYGAKDRRIHVIHQENGGVSAARNAGLDWVMAHSDSQWINFVDSDDWVHPRMLEILLKTAEEQKVHVSACGFLETTDGELTVTPDQLAVEQWQTVDFYHDQPILGTVPWGKLYAKHCFDAIRYPVGAYFDDEFVTYRILFQQDTIPLVPAALYGYYINPEGLTKRPWIPRRMDVWKAYEQQIEFFRQRGDMRMLRSRYREYLDNAYGQLLEVQQLPDAAQNSKRIKKALLPVIKRAWKLGYVEFWMDYDMLYACAPIRTKAYRLWLERKK